MWCPSAPRSTLVNLSPKYPTLVAKFPPRCPGTLAANWPLSPSGVRGELKFQYSPDSPVRRARRAARAPPARRGTACMCARRALAHAAPRTERVRPHSALSATPTISGRWCLPHRVKLILAVAFLKPIRQLNLVDTLSQPRGSSRPALVAPPGLLALGEDLVLLLLLRLRAAAATARQHLRLE